EPPPFDRMVQMIEPGRPDAGDGNAGPGGGGPVDQEPRREARDNPALPKPEAGQRGEVPKLEKPKVTHDFDFLLRDPDAEKLLVDPTESMKVLGRIDEGTRKLLIESTTRGPRGPGPGGQNGPPGGKVDIRIKRALRWTMTFNTEDG